MLDLIGTTVITAAIVVNLNAVITMMPLSSAQRLTGVAIAGLPLVVAAIAALSSAKVREVLLALPLPLLVGLNIMRIFGAFFLLLAAQGRLSGPFPQSAGWGDVIVGLTAIPLAAATARNLWGNRRAVLAWNILGTLDLVIAVSLGVASA